MENFNHRYLLRGKNTGHKPFRRFLEFIDGSYFLQGIEVPARRGAMLDLALTTKEGLVGNMKLQVVKECEALPALTMNWQSFRSLGQ